MAAILRGVMGESDTSRKDCVNTSRLARRRSRSDLRRFGVVSASRMVENDQVKKRQRLWTDGDASVMEEEHVVELDQCPGYGMTSVCGRRKDMEDRVSIKSDFLNRYSHSRIIPGGLHFFGVFDGHGCSHVATKCKDRMHDVVAEEMEVTSGNGKGDSDNLVEWTSVMKKSFSRVDAESIAFGGDGNCKCALRTSNHVGSTAVVAVVSSNYLVVSNCGDSRAVLSRGGVAVPLSSDHKPDRADELKRIQDEGGRVIYWDGARVSGVLAMSRAIGDHLLKPYVTAEPEVSFTERKDKDECLILASDGLWDVVSNSTACEVARMCLRSSSGDAESGPIPEPESVVDNERDSGKDKQGGSEKACVRAAVLLKKLAIARHSADNVSVVVIDLRRTKVRRNSCSRRA